MAKRVLRICGLALMGVVILINLLTMFLNGSDLNERLNWMPGALLTVDSGSMEPVLSEGDLLLIWETPYEKLQVGDMITFHGNNELITHQIVRQEGELFVPRGVANNVEDAPIGPAEYCAKVIWVIPQGGEIMQLVTSPVGLVMLILFVIAVFFGMPVLNWLCNKSARSEHIPVRIGVVRLMAAGMTISMCCVAPFVTAAKYAADINEYGFASAGVTYFTSNYLSKEGKQHYVEGWGGGGAGLTLEIRNYENDLLFNEKSVSYELRVEINTASEYETGYSIVVKDDESESVAGTATAGSPFSREYTLSGSSGADAGPKKTQFQIEVVTPDGSPLNANEKINFKLWATTKGDKDFNQTLMGEFTYVVAGAGSFLGQRTLTDSEGTSLVTYNIKTQMVGGAATRNIQVSWPSNLVYLNIYETTVANIRLHYPDNYREDDGTGRGYLIMPLHAYSNVTLQFFKYDPKTVLNSADFVCVELESG